MTATKAIRRPKWKAALDILVAIPTLLLILVVGVPYYLAYGVWLRITIWVRWCERGTDVLFVYSDSPIWRDYLEEHVLPRIAHRAQVLNWSQRKRWEKSLATQAFHYFKGDKSFNPMAIIFRPWRPTRTFRFLQPFKDFKHGKAETLQRMQSEFFDLIDRTSVVSTPSRLNQSR